MTGIIKNPLIAHFDLKNGEPIISIDKISKDEILSICNKFNKCRFHTAVLQGNTQFEKNVTWVEKMPIYRRLQELIIKPDYDFSLSNKEDRNKLAEIIPIKITPNERLLVIFKSGARKGTIAEVKYAEYCKPANQFYRMLLSTNKKAFKITGNANNSFLIDSSSYEFIIDSANHYKPSYHYKITKREEPTFYDRFGEKVAVGDLVFSANSQSKLEPYIITKITNKSVFVWRIGGFKHYKIDSFDRESLLNYHHKIIPNIPRYQKFADFIRHKANDNTITKIIKISDDIKNQIIVLMLRS